MKHELARYDAYKDSGVEWLGEVPAHWEIDFLVKVLSSLVDYRGRTPKKVNPDENGMFLVTARNIKKGCINYSLSEEFVDIDDAQSLLNRGKPKIGDVLFTTEAPLGEVANVDREDFALAQRIIKFRGKRNSLNNYFMKYWLLSSVFQNTLQRNATGSTALGLKGSKVRLLNIFIPKLPEQTVIAAYLDTKTAHIDRKIDLLTQKTIQYGKLKQSLINETVTRGLDKSVTMKDSGVEWIGKIPIHWEVTRNKDIFEERGNLSNSGTETLLTVSHITGVTRRTEKNVNMFMAETMKGYKLCEKGDLIINTMWAWMGALGTCNENGICSPAYGVYKSKKHRSYNHRYFDYLYRTPNSITEMTKKSKGIVSSRLRLYPKEFFQIKTALSNYAEQKTIANYLDTKTANIDRIVETINTQIEKLKELRKTLINDVVIGKIKVVK